MGAPSGYDRDVHGSSSSESWGSSTYAAEKLSSSTLDKTMEPKGKKIRSNSKNPVIIMLDVTGSNINFARLVYDKLPMFYGEIFDHKYLEDFDISICAVGDAFCDDYPLQISDFAKGIEIDSWIEKIVLESGGGFGLRESYEMAAHYIFNNFEFDKDAKPIIFFIGDEMGYENVDKSQAKELEIPVQDGYSPWVDLNKKMNDRVYMMLNKYCGREFRNEIVEYWQKNMPSQHVVKISEEKAIVDQMLGIIAVEGKKSLKTYALDMGSRGQTKERIAGVISSLQELATTMALQSVEDVQTDLPMTRRLNQNKGTRIG